MSFKYLDCHYAKDTNFVYSGQHKIDGADPLTFEVENWSWEKDKNSYFYCGKKCLKLIEKHSKFLTMTIPKTKTMYTIMIK